MAIKIYAVVKERENHLFVGTLTEREADDLGDYGVELMVREYCEKKSLTFVDYAL